MGSGHFIASLEQGCLYLVLSDMKPSRLLQQSLLKLILVLGLASSAGVFAADALHLNSSNQSGVLVELYTSEGCSSCPPAESFLNSLKEHKALWSPYIPVAFHVDYWDYIGWRDPYAHPAHGKRQSQYARSLGQRTVYTPAFMVNGKPWRKGLFERKLPAQGLPGGALDVKVHGSELSAKYRPMKEGGDDLVLHVAVLGMGLSSQITAGENRGRAAQHEFVVVGYRTAVSASGNWILKLPKLHYDGAEDYALAVWVSGSDNPIPLQAVGGLLPQKIVPLIQ
jgi:hypothetical protein